MRERVRRAVGQAYGLSVTDVVRVHSGTATDNFVVSDSSGPRWFAKVYRDHGALARDEAAIDLTTFARDGGLPVPQLHRTSEGMLIEHAADVALSLWDFVADAETAEGGLAGPRWEALGSVVGRLHRRLAEHPWMMPEQRSASGVCDVDRAVARYDQLIASYRKQDASDPFQAWALEAAVERRALLPRVRRILTSLPPLTVQVGHGDLAAPNVLLRSDDVAAIIDFQPPSPTFMSWEIARIGCDPRTIVRDDEWLRSLPVLLAAYDDEYPATGKADLNSVVAVGCAYTLASTYPLAEPLKHPGRVDEALHVYARARHRAALIMLDHVDG